MKTSAKSFILQSNSWQNNFSAIFILLILIMPFVTVSQGPAHYVCYRTTQPVTADGFLNEPIWSLAAWSADFTDITGKIALKPPLRSRVKMAWDDQFLYIAAELQEPHIRATITQRDAVIFQDNDFEVFIDPDGSSLNYAEVEVNALGTVWDLRLSKPYKDGGKADNHFDLRGLKVGIQIKGTINQPDDTDSSWIIEMALPIDELLAGKEPHHRPAEGVQWRMNFSRVQWHTDIVDRKYTKRLNPETGKPLPEENWVWSKMKVVSMHIPDRWGYLEFSQDEPEKVQDPLKAVPVLVWMDGHKNWSVDRWDSAFDGMKSHGITGILTQAGPSTLKTIIPLARKYDIEVGKWFITLLNNDSLLLHQHPDWFMVNREGNSSVTHPAYVGYYRFLCPSNPEVLPYLKERLREYLAIDGLKEIHLDYIRCPDVILPEGLWSDYGIVQDHEYPSYDYCYCQHCRQKFVAQGGKDPLEMEHPEDDPEWRKFRYDQITGVVRQLANFCHQEGKQLSAAVFPGPSTSKRLVRQTWDQWPLDRVMPMLYQRFYLAPLGWIGDQTAEGVRAVAKAKTPFYSGLYIPGLHPVDLRIAIRESLEGGATGICLFNYESISPLHWEVLRLLQTNQRPIEK